MSRYVSKKLSSSSPPRPPFGRPRSWTDEEEFFADKLVMDLTVYDVEPVSTGIVDSDGNEIMRIDVLDHFGFFPLKDIE